MGAIFLLISLAVGAGERAWAWSAFVFIANLAGLLAYILARWQVDQSGVSTLKRPG